MELLFFLQLLLIKNHSYNNKCLALIYIVIKEQQFYFLHLD
jgi:hypothetical protein